MTDAKDQVESSLEYIRDNYSGLKPASTVTTRYYEVERRDDYDWPSLPWPDWKPSTTKMMRPQTVVWDVSERDGKRSYSRVMVFGFRINASGLGAQVSNTYWRDSKMPDFVRELVKLGE